MIDVNYEYRIGKGGAMPRRGVDPGTSRTGSTGTVASLATAVVSIGCVYFYRVRQTNKQPMRKNRGCVESVAYISNLESQPRTPDWS